jgi:hypothetical protein
MVADPRRSLDAALASARHSAPVRLVVVHSALVASVHRCKHVLLKAVLLKAAGLNVVALVVRRHAVPKVVAMIAGPKVAAPMLVRRHVVRKEEDQVVGQKHAAMMIVAPKVAVPVVLRRVVSKVEAKALVVVKVAVVRRHPAMMMSRFNFGTLLDPSR